REAFLEAAHRFGSVACIPVQCSDLSQHASFSRMVDGRSQSGARRRKMPKRIGPVAGGTEQIAEALAHRQLLRIETLACFKDFERSLKVSDGSAVAVYRRSQTSRRDQVIGTARLVRAQPEVMAQSLQILEALGLRSA